MDWHFELSQDLEIPIGRMPAVQRTGNSHIIEARRALAGVIKTDQQLAPCKPSENRAASQSLQINHPIKFLAANPSNAPKRLEPVLGRGPRLTIKSDDPCKVRVIFQQRGEPGFDPPIDMALRKVLFE